MRRTIADRTERANIHPFAIGLPCGTHAPDEHDARQRDVSQPGTCRPIVYDALIAMSVVITVNTPWLAMAACALCRRLAPEPVHALLVTKGDAPELRATFDMLTAKEQFASREVFAPKRLSGTFSSYMRPWDWGIPGRARKLIDDELGWLEGYLQRTSPSLLLVGNKHHAPERGLLAAARAHGARTGFVEEGLSIYQLHNYWVPGRTEQALRRVAYLYQRVDELYGTTRHRFSTAFISLPRRYPHQDCGEVQPLFERTEIFRAVAHDLLARSGADAMARDLVDGLPVLLSQRLSEDGLITADEELRVLRSTVETLLDSYPAVYFKAHPRDRSEKIVQLREPFGSDKLRSIASSQVPLEAFLAAWRPSMLVGYVTASLVYGRLLYGIPGYTIAPYLRGDARLADFTSVIDRCEIPRFELPLVSANQPHGDMTSPSIARS
jgi:hypothetical protein